MTGSESDPGTPWQSKVLAVHAALQGRAVPHAFGGAIALNYHREPRTTLDIDINVFLAPDESDAALSALDELYDLGDGGALATQLGQHGQARTLWDTTYVDLFFSNTPFHDAMAERAQTQPFADARIPVLSIEDLLVCKILFDRGRDWVDVEAVLKTRGSELDARHIDSWLDVFLPPDDRRLARLQSLRDEVASSERSNEPR